jgi:hypothetical protein
MFMDDPNITLLAFGQKLIRLFAGAKKGAAQKQ